jgi:glycosyltransferase involved in cell wall biosynthesis
MVETHRRRKTWQKKVNRIIALTEFAREKYIEAGLPEEKVVVKPNFIFPDPGMGKDEGNYALFVGRISTEKGIITLMRAWNKIQNIKLKIAGEGPLFEKIKNIITNYKNYCDIEILGNCDRILLLKLMKGAKFLIFPSEWYEGFPMTLVEAFACGKAVVASKLGSMSEIVEDRVTGLHFKAGNSVDLSEKVQWLVDNPNVCRRLGENSRKIFLQKYTADKNYEILMKIYKNAIHEVKKR